MSDSGNPLSITAADQATFRQAVVRPDNPPTGIAGFVMDIPEEELVSLASDISEHYVEDNTTVVDQVALKPESITLRGVVAELVSSQETALPAPVAVQDPLPDTEELAGASLTPQQAQAQTAAQTAQEQTQASLATASSIYELYDRKAGQQPNETKQQKAYRYFYALWKSRELFTVETPYGTFTDMVISSLTMSQQPVSRYLSDVSITFVKIRQASAVSVTVGQLAGRARAQSAAASNLGNIGLSSLTNSKTSSLLTEMGPPP